MTDQKVSIILRSYNEGWALKETLPALSAQNYNNWELIVVDSGFDQTSPLFMIVAKPIRRTSNKSPHAITIPSRVMNRARDVAFRESNYCLFLNRRRHAARLKTGCAHFQRRRCTIRKWRRVSAAKFRVRGAKPFSHAITTDALDQTAHRKTGGIFSAWSAAGCGKTFGKSAGSSRNFSTRKITNTPGGQRARDYKVSLWCEDAVVMHSHNYTPDQAYKRSFGDARALAASWDKSPLRFNPVQTILGWANDTLAARFCVLPENQSPHRIAARRENPLATKRRGILDGFKEGWRHYRILQNENPGHK